MSLLRNQNFASIQNADKASINFEYVWSDRVIVTGDNTLVTGGWIPNKISAGTVTPIVPSDTVNITGSPLNIFIGKAGAIAAVFNNQVVLFSGLAAGQVLPISPTRINATNTTADNIVALF